MFVFTALIIVFFAPLSFSRRNQVIVISYFLLYLILIAIFLLQTDVKQGSAHASETKQNQNIHSEYSSTF